ncbi:MAG: type I polyketide synthase, partial [Myxococcota bacterium]|nr:type I polyketide synthase [Myxococcota bacterium]
MAPKDTSASYREALTGALQKIKRLQAAEAKLRSEPIAVVSMACRYPGGAVDPESLWDILRAGRDVVTEVPPSRFDVDAYFDPDQDAPGKIYTRCGGFVGDVDRFDASFFGISPREAKRIDPQERLLLETTWELFERIGIVPATLAGSRTGVYLGISSNDYLFLDGMNEADVDAYSILGTAHSAVAGRLSYWLGLEGPNLPVDTACSSSLVSLHLACQALRHGDCDMAITGGVNLLLSSYGFVYFSRLKALSPTGRCHTFSKDADGYVRAEGCGLLLLKRLSDAQRDGDEILGLIRGSAVNQDGQSNGFTAPNGPAQQAVIRRALEVAKLDPQTIDYVECHGTGTALGDPIEVQALAAVYGKDRAAQKPVALGSIKSNIGHAESAAGVAGVIKTILALRHRMIPKTLHAEDLNPHIPWSELPVRVTSAASDWFAQDTPRRAAVSAFGFSGTNAHVILEEAPTQDAPAEAEPDVVQARALLLSGQTPQALAAQAERLAAWIRALPDASWSHILQSAAHTRTHFETRAVIWSANPERALEALDALGQGRGHPAIVEGEPATGGKIAFLFTGQGSQRIGMGRGLYEAEPLFAAAFDEACEAIDVYLEQPLRSVVFEGRDTPDALIHETRYTQPALFALEVAVVKLWAGVGVRPDWVMGHSIGELVAAHVAGVLSLDDAAKLVCARGRLMQRCEPGGAMASLQATEAEVRETIRTQEGTLDIAGINGPEQVVVSGDVQSVSAVCKHFADKGRRTKRLQVSHAFHSAHMDGMLAEFESVARGCTYAHPSVPMVSNVTGDVMDAERVRDPMYWVRHVREAVRFADGMAVLVAQGVTTFVECGPGGVLSAMGASCVSPESGVHLIASMRRDGDEVGGFDRAMAGVHVLGHTLDWTSRVGSPPARPLRLPTYAFQRTRYWLDNVRQAQAPGVSAPSDGHEPKPFGLSDDLLALPESVRRRELQRLLREETAMVLGAEEPDAIAERKGFMELGFDSLMAVELQKRLQRRLGVILPATLAFDHPTIHDATAWLLGELNSAEPLTAGASRTQRLDEPLAIVGVGLNLPGGAHDLDDLWGVLSEERDTLVDIPSDRFQVGPIYDPDPNTKGKTYVRRASLIEDVASFDAAFFGISPREAEPLDPQHRLLLETAWIALEHAGLPPASLRGSSTGVFVGIGANEYADYRGRGPDESDAYDATGTMTSFAAGRLAYHLGLQGPTLALDTACSSSLVALHLAGSALRRGDCDVALACGVQVVASPMGFVLMSRTQALAPDGRSKTFSNAANGYGRGEGAGVLVLMRQSDAESTGRPILGLVRGSAMNHDGPSSGITAPNGTSQQKVIRAALRDANLGPLDVDTIECHGTGTRLGDPIEVQALAAVYGEGREDSMPLRLGSVKTNLGHLEAAAGVAAVLKVLASMRYRTQPAALHAQPLNQHIPWDSLPVKVVDEETPWRPYIEGAPLRVGISSFGMSGTNAHVIMEAVEPRVLSEDRDSQAPALLVLSAQNDASLRAQARRWHDWMRDHPETPWSDLVYTAALSRTHFDTRAAIVAQESSDAAALLDSIANESPSRHILRGKVTGLGKLAFLFTGQGSQLAKMGYELHGCNAFFRDTLNSVAAALDPHLGHPLLDTMFADSGTELGNLLGQTAYTQPALFALEVSFARLWQALAVHPDILLGHSIGELTAAHVGGVLSLDDAAKLVCARGRLMQACQSGGAMASIQATEDEVRAELLTCNVRVDIAGLNGPQQTVISGDESGVIALMESFRAQGRKVTQLTVSHAFHSAHMDSMLDAFETVARECVFVKPSIPIVSNVTGQVATDDEICSPEYWVRHVREAVRFVDGIQVLVNEGVTHGVECGPQGVLSAMGAGCVADDAIRFISSHRKAQGEHATLSRALGELYCAGYDLDWARALHGCAGRHVELPPYAFQRRRYWLAPSRDDATTGGFHKHGHPLLGAVGQVAGRDVSILTQALSLSVPSWVKDHVVLEQTLLPGAAFMEMMRAAGEAVAPESRLCLTDAVIQRPLRIDEGADVQVQVTVQPASSDD